MERSLTSGRDGRPEGGYTLVAFVVTLAVMSIMMGVAVQVISFQARREKEAELIFRGQQYVEAIRLYKMKYGRYPNSLKEIWTAKPRVIRKKWKDPITDSWYWGIVHPGQEGGKVGRGGGGPGRSFGTPTPTVTPTPFPTPAPGTPPEQLPMEVGPIIGVYSTSGEQSIKVWEGRTTYREWKFVYKEQKAGAGSGGKPPAPPGPPRGKPPSPPGKGR